MSYEVWGEPEDPPELPDGWWDEDTVGRVQDAVKALASESLYEGGKMESGVSEQASRSQEEVFTQLVCAFKRGDMVRWNAIALHGDDAKGWRVTGLACREGLAPIYSVRKGRMTGEAPQFELEAE